MNIKAIANNQLVMTTANKQLFVSYESVIVLIDETGTYLDMYKWDYSRTTAKYRNKFLNETTKEIAAKLRDGVYKLIDLNK